MKPFITVVMPVRNEVRFIEGTLQQLVAQDYPQECYEILVVDGMSDDGTRQKVTEFSRRYQNIRLLDNPRRLSSAGRNIGFTNGRGEYFVVVDGHCYIIDNQLFNNIIECFEKSGADCLGRPQTLDPPGLSFFQQAVALARSSKIGHSGDSLIYGAYEGYASPASNGAMYRKEVFEIVGYVDEHFDACEDLEHNYRIEKAGLRAYCSPKLAVRYYPRDTLLGLFRQMIRYGRGRFRFVRKHRKALTVNQVVPAGFVVGIFLLLLLLTIQAASLLGLNMLDQGPLASYGLVSHWLVRSLTFMYTFYALLVLFESFRLALRNDLRFFMVLPLIFTAIHGGLGTGFLSGAADAILQRGSKSLQSVSTTQ